VVLGIGQGERMRVEFQARSEVEKPIDKKKKKQKKGILKWLPIEKVKLVGESFSVNICV